MNTKFRGLIQCIVREICSCFWRTCCLHLKVTGSAETSVISCQIATRRDIPECINIRENHLHLALDPEGFTLTLQYWLCLSHCSIDCVSHTAVLLRIQLQIEMQGTSSRVKQIGCPETLVTESQSTLRLPFQKNENLTWIILPIWYSTIRISYS